MLGADGINRALGAHPGCTAQPLRFYCYRILNNCKKPLTQPQHISVNKKDIKYLISGIQEQPERGAAKHPEILSLKPRSLLQIQHPVFPEGEEGNYHPLPPRWDAIPLGKATQQLLVTLAGGFIECGNGGRRAEGAPCARQG